MKHTTRRIAWPCVAALLLLLHAGQAHAGTLEPAGINLGLTSFFDGFGAAEPGFAYLGYYNVSHLNHVTDAAGSDSPAFKDPRIDLFLLINQLVYTSPVTLFDGSAHLGFIGLLPLVGFNTGFDPNSPVKLTSVNGFGDLTTGAFLQFDPIKRDGRAVFSHRLEFDVIARSATTTPPTTSTPARTSGRSRPTGRARGSPPPSSRSACA